MHTWVELYRRTVLEFKNHHSKLKEESKMKKSSKKKKSMEIEAQSVKTGSVENSNAI